MTGPAKIQLPFVELVGVVAAAMALNALAVDMMLPALGIIGDELGAAHDNDRQLIIIVYVLANGVAQLFFGPIVDRFGRKRVLLWSLAAYVVGSLLSVVASSFTLLLAARALHASGHVRQKRRGWQSAQSVPGAHAPTCHAQIATSIHSCTRRRHGLGTQTCVTALCVSQ